MLRLLLLATSLCGSTTAAQFHSLTQLQVDEDEEAEDDYLVDHSIVLYLINPEGEFVEFYPQRVLVADIVEGIEKFQKEYKKSKKVQ